MRMNRTPFHFLSLGLSLLLAGASSDLQAQALIHEPAEMRAEAFSLYRDGRYEQAITLYRQLAELQPDNLMTQKDLMWALWNSGQYNEGTKMANQVLKLAPQDPEAQSILHQAPETSQRDTIKTLRQEAVEHYQDGDYTSAVAIYEKLNRIEPKNARTLKDLMWCYWNNGQYDDAGKIARDLLRLRPNDEDVKHIMSRYEAANGRTGAVSRYKTAIDHEKAADYEQALALFQQLATDYPENASYLHHSLSILNKLERYADGIETANRLVKLQSQDPKSWNWLGLMELNAKNDEASMEAYQQSLAILADQPTVYFSVAKLYLRQGDLDRALQNLLKAKQLNPGLYALYPVMARTYYFQENYADAVKTWNLVIEHFPQRSDYRFNLAQALYMHGKKDEARAIAEDLRVKENYEPAWDFLIDDALIEKKIDNAIELFKGTLTHGHPNENRTQRLLVLYEQQKRYQEWETFITQALETDPTNAVILLSKGSLLYIQKRYAESLAAYQTVHNTNRYNLEALQGIAEAAAVLNNKEIVLQAMKELMEWDPTNPYYLLANAQYLYTFGEHEKAKAALTEWLKDPRNQTPALPILLYHGLTTDPHDPMLNYSYHMLTSSFDDQMHALAKAGFHPVTGPDVLAWYQGERPLPEHPVWINFDDNRLDSFKQGDPVLEKYGLTATMNIAVVNLESNFPSGFAVIPVIRRYISTGRWNVESHGDVAHRNIVINDQGERKLSLINRGWLEKEHRLETELEWKKRVEDDHESSKDKIDRYFKSRPVAYAYPEGAYGQTMTPNVPTAAEFNQSAIRHHFKIALIQDDHGQNVQSQDPFFTKRLIPNRKWSGAELLRQLRLQAPAMQFRAQLAEWAQLEHHPQEALMWLKQMRQDDSQDALLLAKIGQIQYAQGDTRGGEALIKQAMTLEHLPEMEEWLRAQGINDHWGWEPTFNYQEDNSRRHMWRLSQRLYFPRQWGVQPYLIHSHGEYHDPIFPTVLENAGGLGLGTKWNRHVLDIQVMGHAFSLPGQTAISAEGTLYSEWNTMFQTGADLGLGIPDTARAIDNHITERHARLHASVGGNGPWRAQWEGRAASLSDDNRRLTSDFTADRLLWSPLGLRAVYRFTYDDMRVISPNYYSPQALRIHALGPEVTIRLLPKLTFYSRYLPGYAQENGVDSDLNHSVETYLLWEPTADTVLRPSFAYYKTPSYRGNFYELSFTHYF